MIIIRRSSDWEDIFASYEVIVDEKSIGKLKRGKEIILDVAKGEHSMYLKKRNYSSKKLIFKCGESPIEFECGNNSSTAEKIFPSQLPLLLYKFKTPDNQRIWLKRIKKTIIFDIDGTLWNASEATAKGWNLGLEKAGIDKKITAQQVESVTGNPDEVCIDLLLPGFLKQYPNLLETLNEFEMDAIESEGGKFYEGVIEGIKELSKDRKIFLISNCQEWYLYHFLELSGLRTFITHSDCYGISGKTKSEMLEDLKNNYTLNSPIYIGDTTSDEKAAKLAGINFIHVTYGFGTADKLTKKVDSFQELLDMLKNEE